MTCIFCVFNTNCQTVVLVIPLVATSGDAFLKKTSKLSVLGGAITLEIFAHAILLSS